MFARYAPFRKSYATVKSYPDHWFDPMAVPAAPILARGLTDDDHKKQVHWWCKNTVAVIARRSTLSSQEEKVPLRTRFNLDTGLSNLRDFTGDISWDTIKDSTEDSAAVDVLRSPQGKNLPSPTGFNLETGLSNLSDFTGDISWDTIKDSTEDDDDAKFPISTSARDSPDTPAMFYDCSSDDSSDSNLSMVVTDEDEKENFYFQVPQVFDGIESLVMAGESQVEEPLFLEVSKEEYSVSVVGFDEDVRMGEGRVPRRTPTITGMVGEAIRKRRARFVVFADEDCIEPLRQWKVGKSRNGCRYVPHILTTILEEMDEE